MHRSHAIIVGAGPGIGVGAARAFGAAGFAVSLLARGQDQLAQGAKSLRSLGITAEPFVADAADPASLTRGVAAAVAQFGVADTLIYNAVSFSQGMPTTVEFGGTSFTTTELAPIFTLSPIVMSPSTAAPEPTTTLLPIVGWRFLRCNDVPPKVTPW